MSENKNSNHSSGSAAPNDLAHEAKVKRTNGELIPTGLSSLQNSLGGGESKNNGPLAVSLIPDPASLLRSFRRRWLAALVLATLFAGTVGPLTWFVCQKIQQPRYNVYAVLRLASVKPIIAFSVYEPEAGRFRQTQLALITSKFVLSAALRREGISDLQSVKEQVEPLDWLARSIRAGFLGDSDLLRISMVGERPSDLIQVVNAVKDAYLNEAVNAEQNNQKTRIADLDRVSRDWEGQLHEKRNNLEALGSQAGGTQTETLILREKAELEAYTDMLREQGRMQVQIINAEADLSLAKKKAAVAREQDVPDEMIERAIAADPRVAQLRGLLDQQEIYFANYESKVKDKNHPNLKKAKQELDNLREQLHQRESELKPLIVEQIEALRGADVAKIEEKIQSMKEREEFLEKDLQRHKSAANKVGRKSLEIEYLREEIAQLDNVAKTVSSQKEQLKVEVQSPPRVTDLEKADESHVQKDGTRILKISGMATLGSFGLVLLIVCWWDFASHRVDGPGDVERRLGLRVIGTIPALPQRLVGVASGNDDNVQNWFHFLTESVDCLRALLLHESRVSGTRVIMIGSAVGREGKTTLSCHLAASLARTGRRTLLVDGDMRRPTAHRLLNQPLSPGMAEILRGEVDWRDVMRPTSLDTLFMI